MRYELGFIDEIRGRTVTGWAQDPEDERFPALVDIIIDGAVVASVSADQFRNDLALASIRNGYAGFSYRLPTSYCDGHSHIVQTRLSYNKKPLKNSPLKFRTASTRYANQATLSRQTFARLFNEDQFRLSIRQTRKLAVISTFHEFKNFLSYHKSIFKNLTSAGFTCLIVQNCNSYSSLHELRVNNCFLVVKRNSGYDFGSYAYGPAILNEISEHVDEMILTNDSVVHLRDEIGSLILRSRLLDRDLVGVTDSFEGCHHLQSYFLWVGEKLARSGFLTDFFSSFPASARRPDAVEEGELALSRHAHNEGFTSGSICNYEAVASTWLKAQGRNRKLLERALGGARNYANGADPIEQFDMTIRSVRMGVPLNPAHFFWDTMIDEFDVPMLKRDFVMNNPCRVSTYVKLPDLLRDHTQAQSEIRELCRYYGSTLSPLLANDDAARDEGERLPLAPVRLKSREANGSLPSRLATNDEISGA